MSADPPPGVGAAPSPARGNGRPGLTREDVVAAFELLLGRAPESEKIISDHRLLPDRAALGRAIRASAEFHRAQARVPPPPGAGADGPLLALCLGAGGDAEPLLRGGWSAPDRDSRWTVGAHSALELPLPPGRGEADLALSLTLTPFHGPQRLSLAVEGRELAAATLGGPTAIGCRVPAALLAGRASLRVRLHHPDAVSPRDVGPSLDERPLGFAVQALELEEAPRAEGGGGDGRDGEDGDALLRRFQSLGETCEFGFVLSRFDRGGSGLLRFSAMPHDQLLRALRARLEGFPDRARMRVERHATRTGGLEAMVVEDGYRFITHSGIADAALERTADEAILDREAPRLRFLRRLFLEELAEGRTIFVHRPPPGRTHAEMAALWLALRRLGPCTLLWVAEAQDGLPPGTVAELEEGFLKGFLARLAPADNAEDFDLDGWLALCRRAARLARTPRDAEP